MIVLVWIGIAALWLLPLIEIRQIPDEIWKESGSDKSSWTTGLVIFGVFASAAYFFTIRRKLLANGAQKNGALLPGIAIISVLVLGLIFAISSSSQTNSSSITNQQGGSQSSSNQVNLTFGQEANFSNGAIVKIEKVIDPVTDSIQPPDAGKRYIGVVSKWTNSSQSQISASPSVWMLVLGSDNSTYSWSPGATLNSSTCSSDNGTGLTLLAGSSSTTCTGFQLPTGVSVKDVVISNVYWRP